MFCPKCGSQLPDGAAFCGSCGTSLAQIVGSGQQLTQADAVQAPPPAQNPTQMPAAAAVHPAAVPVQAVPAGAAAETAPAAYAGAVVSHRKTGIITIAAIAAAALAAGIAAYFLFLSPYKLDEKTFPDQSLRNAIALQCDFDGDGRITRDQAKEVTSLNLASSGVQSLEGLGLLANLNELDLSGCKSLLSPDVSALSGLTSLKLANSGAEVLDVTKLGGLQELDATGTGIQSLDVSRNGNLVSLHVDDAVVVTGIENTRLSEKWVVSKYRREGMCGSYEGFPTGGGADYTNGESTFSYDDTGRVVSYKTTSWWDDPKESTDNEYSYDYDSENNTVTLTSIYDNNRSSRNETVFAFNDSGQIVAETQQSYSDGSVSHTQEYLFEYDDQNRLVARSSENSSGEYFYNDANQLVEIASVYGGGDSSPTRHTVALLEYNDAGLLSKLEMDRGKYEFDYDEQGRCAGYRKYWKTYDGQDYMNYSYGTDWATLDKVEYGEPTVASCSYDNAGALVSVTSDYDNMDDPDYPSFSHLEGMLQVNDFGQVIGRTYRSTYGSKDSTGESESSESFEYARVFVAADGPDVQVPLSVDNPLGFVRHRGVRGRSCRFLDDQPEFVRSIVIGSALYDFS